MKRRRPQLVALSLAVTVALAVALGAIVYLSVTALPYLATSPTTDPAFGAVNACALAALPGRLGFAVSADGAHLAAWSGEALVECAGTPPVATRHAVAGVTVGAFDRSGSLWIAANPADGGGASLARLESGAFVQRGPLAVTALVGTAHGVVALDASGQLLAVGPDGAVAATRAVPFPRQVQLAASADGTLVSLVGAGRFAVVKADTLESTPAEAPCPVTRAWWRPGGTLLLVQCVDLAFEVDALTSVSALADPRRRVPSVLLGPSGLYVQPCDGLPCSAEPPR